MNVLLERLVKNGALAIFANLLFDVVFLGWFTFAGLYSIEALLPTFITARLSLVKFSVLLIGLTVLLALLRKKLPREKTAFSASASDARPFLLAGIFSLGIITIAHYRFPWWSLPFCIGGYALIVWLFFKCLREES